MDRSKYIRCIHIEKGFVRYLVPMIANDPIRMKSMGFRKDELPKPAEIPTIVKVEEPLPETLIKDQKKKK